MVSASLTFFTIGELDNARESDQKVSGSSEHQAYLSHIGRLTYDYKGKYLAELACRYDGSYRYCSGQQMGILSVRFRRIGEFRKRALSKTTSSLSII